MLRHVALGDARVGEGARGDLGRGERERSLMLRHVALGDARVGEGARLDVCRGQRPVDPLRAVVHERLQRRRRGDRDVGKAGQRQVQRLIDPLAGHVLEDMPLSCEGDRDVGQVVEVVRRLTRPERPHPQRARPLRRSAGGAGVRDGDEVLRASLLHIPQDTLQLATELGLVVCAVLLRSYRETGYVGSQRIPPAWRSSRGVPKRHPGFTCSISIRI